MSYDEALDKRSEKFNSRLLVQEEHGFQEGVQFPLATGEKKPGLDKANTSTQPETEWGARCALLLQLVVHGN